jgi:hypothetical protein
LTYEPKLSLGDPISSGEWITRNHKQIRAVRRAYCPRKGCQRLLVAVYRVAGRDWLWLTGSRVDDTEMREGLIGRWHQDISDAKAELEKVRAKGWSVIERELIDLVAEREQLIRDTRERRWASRTPPMASPMGARPWPAWHDRVSCPGCHHSHRVEITDSGAITVSGSNAVL